MSNNIAIVITGNAQPFVQTMRQATAHAQAFAGTINNIRINGGGGGGSSGNGVLSLLAGGAGGFAAGAASKVLGAMQSGLTGVAHAGFEAGKAAVEAAADYQMAAAAFETMTGSAVRGKGLLDTLQQFAVATPFSSADTINNAKTLMAMNVQQKELIPVMRALGDIAVGDADRFNRLAYAFSTTNAAGKLIGNDLLQFTQAGIGAADFAETMKVSVGQFYAMKEAGQVSASVVTQTLNRLTQEGGRFAGGMERASQTVQGQWNAMKESGVIAMQKLGLAAFKELRVANALGGLSDGITATLANLAEKSGPVFKEMRTTGVVAFAALKAGAETFFASMNGGEGVRRFFQELRNGILISVLGLHAMADMLKSLDGVFGVSTKVSLAWATAAHIGEMGVNTKTGSMADFAKRYQEAIALANRTLDGTLSKTMGLTTAISDQVELFADAKKYAEGITAAMTANQTPYQKFVKEMEMLRVNNLFGEGGGMASRGATTLALNSAFLELEKSVGRTALELPKAAMRNTTAAESIIARAQARGPGQGIQERIKNVLDRALEQHQNTARNTRDIARGMRELLDAGEGF